MGGLLASQWLMMKLTNKVLPSYFTKESTFINFVFTMAHLLAQL